MNSDVKSVQTKAPAPTEMVIALVGLIAVDAGLSLYVSKWIEPDLSLWQEWAHAKMTLDGEVVRRRQGSPNVVISQRAMQATVLSNCTSCLGFLYFGNSRSSSV